jgi:hypothetical protein
MRKRKNDASGSAENRTQRVETIERQGDRANSEQWQALCGPPPEVSGSSGDPGWAIKQQDALAPNERGEYARKDRLGFLPIKSGSETRLSNQLGGPCNAIRPSEQPPSPFWL